MMFLLISACSIQRKGKETYWCTCCPIEAQFGLRVRHVHWAVKGHLGLFIASVGSVRFRSGPLRPGLALFNLSRSDLSQLRQALLGFISNCSESPRTVKSFFGFSPNCSAPPWPVKFLLGYGVIFLGSFEPVLFQFRLLRILFMASTTLPRFGVSHGSSQHP
jgi:hypothetical protein